MTLAKADLLNALIALTNGDNRAIEQPKAPGVTLRKAGAAIAAERGATDRQLMAIFGWATAAQATVYTKAARRRKLAVDAPRLLRRNEDK